MNKDKRNDGILKIYLRWVFYLGILFFAASVVSYLIAPEAGIASFVMFIIYMIIAVVIYRIKGPDIINVIMKYSANFDTVQNRLLKEMVTPYAVLDKNGAMIWANGEFMDIIGYNRNAKKSISLVIPELVPEVFPVKGPDNEIHVVFKDVNYKILIREIDSDDLFKDTEYVWTEDEVENRFIAIYLYDETQIIRLEKENDDQRTVVALLYIDNYEEALESVDEVRRSLLIALIERKLNKYIQSIDAVIKRLEKDKYLVVFHKKHLEKMKEEKFSILEEVRGINIGNEISVTLSMGIGLDAPLLTRNYEYARAAIDLALGRGGDQVVIKDGTNVAYYGGKSVQIEKTTRVRARVKAHAMRELFEARDEIYVMGHSIGDVDCFGAAVGICRIAKSLGKKAYIVLDTINGSLKPVVDRVKSDPEYGDNVIINNETALSMVNSDMVLVVVDVNKPNYTECPKLLEKTRNIIVLDHHRQTGEQIENAVLSYVEPYASSACEMVAEIIQYIDTGLKLKTVEADALYAGMVVDTSNFQNRTGVRTFEAAAFLRRNGADVTRIRKYMRIEMNESRVISQSLSAAEVFAENFVITVCNAKGLESPTVVGAKVANSLLDVAGVKASFVLTEYNGKIYISARSIDEVNVQIIMEKFGGGGHMNMAGAQMTLRPVEEAKQTVKLKVMEMLENGEI